MGYDSIAVFHKAAFSNNATFNRNGLKLPSRTPDNPSSTRCPRGKISDTDFVDLVRRFRRTGDVCLGTENSLEVTPSQGPCAAAHNRGRISSFWKSLEQ